MRRREFIVGSATMFTGALSKPAPASAAASWRIGQVFGGTPNIVSSTGLAQGLSDLGYVDGKNIRLLSRYTTPTPLRVARPPTCRN